MKSIRSIVNDTITKFGYPQTLIKEYDHWVVLARPQQVTIGSLVLASKEDAQSLAELNVAAYAELRDAITDLEVALKEAFNYEKINYLALMMVDKEVHFHIFPRYSVEKVFRGITVLDEGWPGIPVMNQFAELSVTQFDELIEYLKQFWY